MEDADDLVERGAVGGVARVRRLDHGREALLGREVDRDRDHLGPRNHHLVHLLAGEVEDLVEHLLLGLLDLAGVLGGSDDHAGCPRACGRRPRPERARFRSSRGERVRPTPGGTRRSGVGATEDRAERMRAPPPSPFLVLRQRDRLRHELAEGHVQVGDDDEREEEGDARRQDGRGSAPRRAARRSRRAAIPKIVIPTWTVLMNRTGSSMSRSAVRARGCRRARARSRRLRRAVTSAYSAATKKAFPSTSNEHEDNAERRRSSRRRLKREPGAGLGTGRSVVVVQATRAV